MKRAEKTYLEFSSDIFNGDELTIDGGGSVVFHVFYPKFVNNMLPEVTIKIEKDGEAETVRILPGDEAILRHSFKITATKDISRKHLFPITFKMDGQEYKLNRTKQNKLILTK